MFAPTGPPWPITVHCPFLQFPKGFHSYVFTDATTSMKLQRLCREANGLAAPCTRSHSPMLSLRDIKRLGRAHPVEWCDCSREFPTNATTQPRRQYTAPTFNTMSWDFSFFRLAMNPTCRAKPKPAVSPARRPNPPRRYALHVGHGSPTTDQSSATPAAYPAGRVLLEDVLEVRHLRASSIAPSGPSGAVHSPSVPQKRAGERVQRGDRLGLRRRNNTTSRSAT